MKKEKRVGNRYRRSKKEKEFCNAQKISKSSIWPHAA
jgi:hypothetical protein